MNNVILSDDRIAHIDEEFMRTNSMVRHVSSTIWKRVSQALKVSFSRPFKAGWELTTYFLVIFLVLLTTIFLFWVVLG